MTALGSLGRRAVMVGAGLSVLGAGAAVGLAAERYAIGRSFRGPDPLAEEPFGLLRGEVLPVTVADGTVLHVERQARTGGAGPRDDGAGEVTVVFCHGYALTMDSWHFQRRDLTDLGPLVFFDQRGHGRSRHQVGTRRDLTGADASIATATIDTLGADLLAVLDAVAPTGRVVLVGHSMGGMTVMALAQAHPELFGDRVIGVALLSTSPGKLADVTLGAPALIGRVGQRLAPGVLRSLSRTPEIYERGWRLGSDLTFVLTKRYSYASDVSARLVEFTAEMLASTPISVISEFFPAFSAHDKLDALPVLHGVETLVLCGDSDLMTPPSHSADIVEAVPAAELLLVPDGGHLVMLEHPETVNAALRSLLARAQRSAG